MAEITESYSTRPFDLVGNKGVFGTDERSDVAPTTFGDSGSGWFNSRNELIGVTAGGGQTSRFFGYNAEFFSPVALPNG